MTHRDAKDYHTFFMRMLHTSHNSLRFGRVQMFIQGLLRLSLTVFLLLSLGFGSSRAQFIDIDNNYWEYQSTVLDPSINAVDWNPSITQTNCHNLLTFSATSSTNLASASTLPDVNCRGGFTTPGKKSERPLAIAEDIDNCIKMRTWIGVKPQFDKVLYKEQYDSLRHYIESCALLDNDWSYRAFPKIGGAVQEYDPKDTLRYDSYRDWLLSVVFLNPNPRYYCSCVYEMARTFPYGKYHISNASLSVIKYLIDNSQCDEPGLDSLYVSSLQSRHESWLSGDTTIPEDTTLPSLEDIGLGILLDHNAVSPSTIFSQVYLSSFTSSPNPFKDETHLRYHLNRTTYVTIGIYDVLGHQVWGDGKGRSLEAGDHELTIDGSSLPEGSLYARISTGFGEVKTVKLIKLLNHD